LILPRLQAISLIRNHPKGCLWVIEMTILCDNGELIPFKNEGGA
jgi:hypothetical protein